MSENRNRKRPMTVPCLFFSILIRNTDDDHKVSNPTDGCLQRQAGHGGNRHTISNDIDILCRYGFDIICSKEGNKNTYSYGSRRWTRQSCACSWMPSARRSSFLLRNRRGWRKRSRCSRVSIMRKALFHGLSAQEGPDRQPAHLSDD